MKFKKLKYPYEFHHYTVPRFARDIVKNGFDKDKNPYEYEDGRIYAFDADDDQNAKGLNHWTDTAIENVYYNYDFRDRKHDQMDLLGGTGGNFRDYNRPQVRIVGKSKTQPEFTEGRDGVRSIQRHLMDAGEKHVNPDDVDNKSLKIQIPFGAVNKYNYKDFAEQLKGVNPSKIDMDDTYTRRILKVINNPNIDSNIKSARDKTTELVKQGKVNYGKTKSPSRRVYLKSIENKLYYDKLNNKTNKDIKDPELRHRLAESLLDYKDDKTMVGKLKVNTRKKQKALDEFLNDRPQLMRGLPSVTPVESVYRR